MTRPGAAGAHLPGHVSAVPEQARAFQGAAAGVVTRSVAAAIDGVLVLVVVVGGYLAVSGVLFLWRPGSFTFPAPASGVTLGLAAITVIGYLAGSWATTGRTYGDHVFGLRVVDRGGALLRPGRALLRAVCCLVAPVGLLWVAVSRENRSLQDLVVRSFVVYAWVDGGPSVHPGVTAGDA